MNPFPSSTVASMDEKPHRKTRKMLKKISKSTSYQTIIRATMGECAAKDMNWILARDILAAKIAEVSAYAGSKKNHGVLIPVFGIGVGIGRNNSSTLYNDDIEWTYIADQYRDEYEALLSSMRGTSNTKASTASRSGYRTTMKRRRR